MQEETNTRGNLEKLRALVEGIDYAMLTTVDSEGKLRSRPMSTQELDIEESALWFFTAEPSAKTREVQKTSKVNVSYASNSGHTYVSVSGEAEMVHDKAKAKELWSEAHRVWFPGGLDDPKLALMKVHIEEAQYWDSPGKMETVFNFAKSYLTNEKFEGGEVKKLTFKERPAV